MQELRYRQIHLDFHTSEYIPEVANDFNGEEFANKLEEADVNSVTCFARCHHGWLYYPSKKFKELIHPNLINKNLLLEQIACCHKKGIKVPIYTTVQWDGRIMREHPEWLSVGEDGKPIDTQSVGDPHFYYTICLNSGYRQFFKEHLQDIIDVVGKDNIDGFFMDILFQVDCKCKNCEKEMKKLGMNPKNKIERLNYSHYMLDDFKKEITNFIKQRVPDASIFYNSSHVSPGFKKSYDEYSHLEIESLPSGGWGYDHFPATSRYARTLGKNLIGMTGKFHTYWGDFHSLKNQAALELECFQMLAMGAGCSIGDQLHPKGTLSEASYELIGKVYKSVKNKEEFCKHTQSVAEIAILNPEEFYKEEAYNLGISPSLIGAVRVLQELSYQFDVVDSNANLKEYELVILPDCIYYTEKLERILKAYIKNGGKVIGSFDSCLNKQTTSDIYGITYIGESPYYREFVMPNNLIGKNLPKEEFVMYLRGYDVKENATKVLMNKIKPYFNREGNKFCSHQHTPSSGIVGCPEVTQNKNVIYFAHPIFALYRKNAARWCKEMLKDALELLIENKLVTHSGPSTVVTSLNKQEGQNREILHILHYITEKRSEDIYTVEDVIPLYHLKVWLYIGDRKIEKVMCVPQRKNISYIYQNGVLHFEIDEVVGHSMICIQYKE